MQPEARQLLAGNTGFMPVTDLLQWLEQNRKSAILTLECPDGQQSVHFDMGYIVFVSSSRNGQQLGEYLEKSGHLEHATVEASLAESQRFKITFTRYLIEEQMLCKEILTQTLTELAEQIMLDVLQQSCCNFTVVPLDVASGDCPIQLQTAHLILDALRKLDEIGQNE